MTQLTISIPGGRAGHFLAGAAVASVLCGTAAAITGNAFKYSSPQTGWYVVGPADLGPEASDAQTIQYSRSSIFFSSGHAPGDDNCFFATLHLPQGVKITKVATTYDSGDQSDPFFRLERENLSIQNDFNILDQSRADGDNSGKRHVLRANITHGGKVDNSVYAYHYMACIGYLDDFYGARITYEYTDAGD